MNSWGYVLLLGLLVMFCADRISPTNEYDPEFTGGDYSLSFYWDDPNTTDTTLLPFIPYQFYCRNTGSDLYSSFSFSIIPDNYTVSSNGDHYQFDENVQVLFHRDGDFTLTLRALRLNNTDTTYSVPLTIINPYEIRVDSATLVRGDTVRCYIVNTSGLTGNDSNLTVRWARDSLPLKEVKLKDSDLTIPVNAFDTLLVKGQIFENGIVGLDLDPVVVAVPKGLTPFVAINEKLYPPIGDPYPIKVTDTSGGVDSLVWKGTSGLDTTTTGTGLEWTWDTPNTDTVTVTAKNRFGNVGNTDTALVFPRTYRYNLEYVDFPDIVPVRDTVTWRVTAYEADTVVADENITYVWTIYPPDDYDTIIDNGTCSIYCNDSIAPFTLSVVAVNDTDSSWTLDANVTVRTWRPGIVLLESPVSARINETLTFVVNTWDTDSSSGGYIAERFYRASFGDTDTQSFTGDTLSFKMTAAGQPSIQFWCIDNKNFSSDTIITSVHVTSDKPYINSALENHITTFSGDTVHFTVEGLPGDNPGSTITDYIWTSKGGTVSDTTPANQYSLVFSEAGRDTVVVLCRNSENEVSETPVKFFITVSLGLPVVDSVICAERTGFIGDSVDLAIAARDSNGTLVAIVVHADTGNFAEDTIVVDPADSIFNDTIRLPLTDTGTIRFFVTAIDDEGYTSEARRMSTPLKVTLGRPRVTNITPKTCWVFDDTTFSVTAADSNSSGSIDTIRVQWESGETWQSFSRSQTPQHLYTTPGVKQVRVVAVDNQGYTSSQYTTSITVNRGTPTVDVAFPATVWINDTEQYTVNGSDDNGDVLLRGIRWDDVDTFTLQNSTIFSHPFSDSGSHTVEAFVIDDDGFSSDTISRTVTVDEGRPVASVNFFDTVWINDDTSYIVQGEDVNDDGSIILTAIRWDNQGSFETQIGPLNATFKHKFLTAGNHTVEAYVLDDDSIASNLISETVYVALGQPSITGVTVDDPGFDDLYIGDTIKFTVSVVDPNNENRFVRVSWNGDQSFEDSVLVVNNAAVFTRKYNRNEDGAHTILFRVFDADNLTDDESYNFTLLKGTPSVNLVSLSEPSDELFVNDPITFSIHAEDINGNIRKIAANWDNGSSVHDSIVYNGTVGAVDTSFTHTFDTTSGPYNVKIWVIDEDTVASTVLSTAINIRKGEPVLWGDSTDTLWVVVDNGIGTNYPIHINHFDTNGTITDYYWNESGPALGRKTISDTIMRNIGVLEVNNGFNYWIYGKDDDSLVRGGKFIVFADSAPPRPASFAYGTSSDSTILKWEKTVDEKDGLKTQVQIYIKYGNTDEPDSALFHEPWPSLDDSRFGEETISGLGLHATYTFKPTISGRWRVVLRDKRGTESIGPNTAGDPATFVVP